MLSLRATRGRTGCSSTSSRAGPGVHRARDGRRRSRRAGAVHRLDVLLRRLGAEGPLPRDSRPSRTRRGRARPLRARADAARPHRQRQAAARARRLRLLAGAQRRRRHRALCSRRSGDATARPRVEVARFPMLRQQEVIADDKPNRSLADFVAPLESGITDYVGAFAVTAGLGADELVRRFEAEHDDYSAIIVKALADRLAEAFAEYLHAQARRDWGYGDGRTAARRTTCCREVPRHPAGVRLSRVPRSQREASAVRSPRRAPHRHGADRELCHDAGRRR